MNLTLQDHRTLGGSSAPEPFHRALARRIEPPPPVQLVLADPPWDFRTYSAKGKDRSADRHYPTMRLPDIYAVGTALAPLLAEDAVLLLWVTDPFLMEAGSIAHAWGFRYVTRAYCWTKEKASGREHIGTGYYTRANPEDCLLFKRGKGLPRRDCGVREWMHTAVGAHSAKPAETFGRTDRLFGTDLVRLELFARERRPGWYALGYDLDGEDIRQSLARLAAGWLIDHLAPVE